MITEQQISKSIADVFVARERELDFFRTVLDEAGQGNGSVVVVTGEAGVGKSALLQHLMEAGSQAGARAVTESFCSSQQLDPYAPFLRVLERILHSDQLKPLGWQSEPHDVSERKQEGHSEEVSILESLYALKKEQNLAQQHLVAAIIEAAPDNDPLIIGLDDVHHAPLSAWKFIHYFSESISNKKIVLVLTLQEQERARRQDQTKPYTDVLQRMNREGLYQRLNLSRFDMDQVREFINSVFPIHDFSGVFDRRAFGISKGNPAQLVKLLSILVEEDIVYQKNEVWFHHDELPEEQETAFMSDDQQLQTASKLVDSLSDSHQMLLRYAALLQGPFDHRVLGQIAGRSRIQIIKDLIALKELKLLTLAHEDYYQFQNPAVHSVVLSRISAKEQSAMHGEIATKVGEADQFTSVERTSLLAYHFTKGDEREAAFRYLNEAGLLALANFAFIEAKDYFMKALAFVTQADENNRRTTIGILVRVAWLNHVLGYWQGTLENCEAAFALCRPDEDRSTQLQILIQKGLTYFRLNDWKNSQRCFDEAHANNSVLGKFENAMINYGLGDVFFEIGKFDKARHHFQEALTIARELDKTQLMASLLNNLGALENVCSQHLRAISLYSESITLSKRLGDNLGLARAYHNIGMTHAEQSNWQEADASYLKSVEVSDKMGLRPLKSITFLNRALALIKLNRFDEAREYNQKALQLLQRLDDMLGVAEYHKIQGILEREENNWQEARVQFEKGIQGFDSLKNKLGLAETLYELGLLASTIEDPASKAECFSRAATIYRELGLPERAKPIERELDQKNLSSASCEIKAE